MKKWTTHNGIQIFQILSGRSNSFLLSFDNKYILVDTSTKNYWNTLIKRLNDINIGKDSLIALILTHVHYDHCENSKNIKELYKTKIIVHESEADLLSKGVNSLIGGAIPITKFLYDLIIKRLNLMSKIRFSPSNYDILVNEKYDLKDFGFNCYILHTPGHTIGSMSIIVDNEIAIVGDSMFGVFNGSIYPPWAADTSLMIKSWKKLLETGCNLFLPSHGNSRNREILEKQYNKYKYKIL